MYMYVYIYIYIDILLLVAYCLLLAESHLSWVRPLITAWQEPDLAEAAVCFGLVGAFGILRRPSKAQLTHRSQSYSAQEGTLARAI